jgi:hypothetical protein
VQRLATAYQLTLPQLLNGASVTLTGHGTLPTAELHLSPAACNHLAALARIPLPHLTRALPLLAPNRDAHHTAAAARWKRLEGEQQPVRACTLCTRHHSHGTTDTAWIHPPPHQLVCPRHHQAAPDPRLTSTLRTWATPEAVNPHLTTTGSASPALLARDLLIYPETVALALTLTTLPSRRHHDTDDSIALIAHQLGLPRLAGNANDPLRGFLTHTRH